MPTTTAVEVPPLDELAPAVRRGAEPEAAHDGAGVGHQSALLLDAELRDETAPRQPGIYVWSDPPDPQSRARAWARALWDETIAGGPLDHRTR